jgi:hypothetical protein
MRAEVGLLKTWGGARRAVRGQRSAVGGAGLPAGDAGEGLDRFEDAAPAFDFVAEELVP